MIWIALTTGGRFSWFSGSVLPRRTISVAAGWRPRAVANGEGGTKGLRSQVVASGRFLGALIIWLFKTL